MKTTKKKLSSWLLVLVLLVAIGLTANAQPCHKVEIATDSVKRAILDKFISESIKTNYFIGDKGMVQVNIYKDEKGRDCWLLLPQIDDSYKDNPPTKYADLDGDGDIMFLVYEANSSGIELPFRGDRTAVIKCLEAVIGDRLYIRPPKQDRWVEFKDPTGKLRRTKKQTITLGNGGSLIIIFNKDGTYKTLTPV